MGQRFCPHRSCDAASILSFAASVQCHVCGFEKPTDHGFEDEQTAREAATHAWLEGTEPSTPRLCFQDLSFRTSWWRPQMNSPGDMVSKFWSRPAAIAGRSCISYAG